MPDKVILSVYYNLIPLVVCVTKSAPYFLQSKASHFNANKLTCIAVHPTFGDLRTTTIDETKKE